MTLTYPVSMHTVSIWRRWIVLAAVAVAVLLASLVAGPADKGLWDVLQAFTGAADPVARTVILDLRLPRALTAFGVGSALAVAGLLLQALFRNPLADPYVLGVSGGAAIGALLAIMLGAGIFGRQLAAAGGAAAAIGVVWMLARDHGAARLLLTGVVVASGCGAVVALLLAIASSEQLRGMVFWLAGDLSQSLEPWPALIAAALACTFAATFGRALNVFAAGELRARAVGLDTQRWRQAVFIAAALLTAVAVVSAGTIGFVGLVGAASGAAAAAQQRPSTAGTGDGAARRQPGRGRGPAGADAGRAAPAAGGRDPRAGGSAPVPAAVATRVALSPALAAPGLARRLRRACR